MTEQSKTEQSKTEQSERYRRLAAGFTHVVEAVPADRWESPSPCEAWTARGVLRHVIDTHRSMPGYAGITLDFPGSVDEDPAAAWAAARDAMQDLMDDPARAAAEYDGYFGRTTVQDTVNRFLGFDLLIHGWDIARATGGDEKLPPQEVSEMVADVGNWGDAIRSEGVCGPAVQVPDDAPEQDRLIAFLGRTP